jgi:hypothetical protein
VKGRLDHAYVNLLVAGVGMVVALGGLNLDFNLQDSMLQDSLSTDLYSQCDSRFNCSMRSYGD